LSTHRTKVTEQKIYIDLIRLLVLPSVDKLIIKKRLIIGVLRTRNAHGRCYVISLLISRGRLRQ
jgi:hypothetical protein